MITNSEIKQLKKIITKCEQLMMLANEILFKEEFKAASDYQKASLNFLLDSQNVKKLVDKKFSE